MNGSPLKCYRCGREQRPVGSRDTFYTLRPCPYGAYTCAACYAKATGKAPASLHTINAKRERQALRLKA